MRYHDSNVAAYELRPRYHFMRTSAATARIRVRPAVSRESQPGQVLVSQHVGCSYLIMKSVVPLFTRTVCGQP